MGQHSLTKGEGRKGRDAANARRKATTHICPPKEGHVMQRMLGAGLPRGMEGYTIIAAGYRTYYYITLVQATRAAAARLYYINRTKKRDVHAPLSFNC